MKNELSFFKLIDTPRPGGRRQPATDWRVQSRCPALACASRCTICAKTAECLRKTVCSTSHGILKCPST